MNSKIRSMLAVLLIGVMLVGATACSKDDKTPADTSQIQTVSAYDTPEKYITLPDISSISVSNSEIDKNLADRIYQIRSSKSYEDYQETTEPAQMGDMLILGFTGRPADESVTLSDAMIQALTAEQTDYTIGSDEFVDAYYDEDENMLTDNFDNQLIGIKAGETREVNVTFADQHVYEELRGLEVVLTVTVESVSRITVTERDRLTVGYTTGQPEGDTATLSEFRAIFSNGRITYDPTAEDADEKVFCMIFKFAEYADRFVGMNKYGELEVKVTVPEDAGEKYAAYIGKEITFHFTLQEASIVPEWNDEMVKAYTNNAYTTTAEYEAMIRNNLIANKAYQALVSGATVIEYPEAETEAIYKQYVADQIALQTGQSVDGYTDEEMADLVEREVYESICASAYNYAKEDMLDILAQEMIFKTLEITITDDEYQKELDKAYADYLPNADYYESQYGIKVENAADFESFYGKEALVRQFKLNKAIDILPNVITMAD